eukprot:4977855-Amphidinium_carterae.1
MYDPVVWALNFRVESPGKTEELPLNVYVWHLAGPAPTLGGAVEVIDVGEASTTVLRVAPTHGLRGRGVWVDWTMNPKCYRAICKEVCPSALEIILDVWVPNSFHGTGTCFVRIPKDRMHVFMQQSTDAGFSVMPPKPIDGTQVVWLKERDLGDAQNQAQTCLANCSETLLWSRRSALFSKFYEGRTSYGLRVKTEDVAMVKESLGLEGRKLYVLKGGSRSWNKCDAAGLISKLHWEAEVTNSLGRHMWMVRALQDPPKSRLIVQSGYERLTVEIEPFKSRNAVKPQAPEVCIPGQKTWSNALKAPAQTFQHQKQKWADVEDSDSHMEDEDEE